jgi:hypothetical protein
MEATSSRIHQVIVDADDSNFLYLTVDQKRYRIRWSECSKRLHAATAEQRAFFDVSPAAYGIHWPQIDEDLAVEPLIQQAERLR